MKRTSSQLSSCSNSSNNPTQTTYLAPLNSNQISNKNSFVYVNNYTSCTNCSGKCQIPTMPPPPLPPMPTHEIPLSKASLLRNKDSFNSNTSQDRFSTFRTIQNKKQLEACDENQYLQPEFNSYSMVDSEFQSESQYYCDDGICSRVEDDTNSDNYVEVIEEYSPDESDRVTGSHHKQSKHLSKLKDLIAMPEEYEKDDCVEASNLSDMDLFNITSSVNRRENNKMRMKKVDMLEKIVSRGPSSVSSSNSTLLMTQLPQSPIAVANEYNNLLSETND
jgi:hypothetical protein